MEEHEFPIRVKEDREIKRITFKKFFIDVFSAFNVERGLVYTVKLLFSHPGNLVRLYLADGRFRVFNPFRLLIFTTAVSLFIMYLNANSEFIQSLETGLSDGSEEALQQELFQEILFDWYNLALWISIPIYGLMSYLFNRKTGYNYAEHMVAQTFYLCGINIINMLNGITLLVSTLWIFVIVLLLTMIYYFWIIPQWLGGKGFKFYFKNFIAFILANALYFSAIIKISEVIISIIKPS